MCIRDRFKTGKTFGPFGKKRLPPCRRVCPSSQRTEKNERGTVAQPIVLPVSRTNALPSLEITEQKRSGPAVIEAIGREGKSCLIFAVGLAFQQKLANFDIKPSDHDTHADDPGRPSFRRNRPVRRKPVGMGTARAGRIPCRSRTGMDSGTGRKLPEIARPGRGSRTAGRMAVSYTHLTLPTKA